MHQYPSIGKKISRDPVIVFDKLDGSNVRVEWTPKKGFQKFGRRRGLLDDSNPILKRTVPIFREKWEQDLHKLFKAQRWQKAVAYFEFCGPSSFAGWHDPSEEQTLTLIDVRVAKKGIIPPSEFVDAFGHLDIPKILYRGRVGPEIVSQVRTGSLEGMTFEGVVCKGAPKKRKPVMFKIKNQAWLDRLKEKCGDNDALFEKLK